MKKDPEAQRTPGDHPPSRGFVREGERVARRLAALVAGVIFAVAGVGLSVTMVLLPIGIPLGVLGLFLIYGAFYGSIGPGRRE